MVRLVTYFVAVIAFNCKFTRLKFGHLKYVTETFISRTCLETVMISIIFTRLIQQACLHLKGCCERAVVK